MSEATLAATAIPREINLGIQKPVATPAYTRRFKSLAANPRVTASSQVTITLDTAQPGSFIDTLSSYLSFGLELVNSSTSDYYVGLSAAGAHAIIRSMRIYVQGVPIEEITEYNALVEWLHDLAGIPDYCDRSAKSRYYSNDMFDSQTILVPARTTRTLNIQLPLVSGVLGTMAEKMFPSMLVAPGNCYIQLDFASAQNALRIQEVDVSKLTIGNCVLGVDGGAGIYQQLVNSNTTSSGPVPHQGPGLVDYTRLQNFNPEPALPTAAPTTTTLLTSLYVPGGKDGNRGENFSTIVDVMKDNNLLDKPLDLPVSEVRTQSYNYNDGTNNVDTELYVGKGRNLIISTDERIGGGMFWNSTTNTNYANEGLQYIPSQYGMARIPRTTTISAAAINNIVGKLDYPGVFRTSQFTIQPLRNSTTAPLTDTEQCWFNAGMLLNGSMAINGDKRMTAPDSASFTYNVVGLEYVGKQIVVGDDVARAIIERAAAGDISIHTQSYRQYPANINIERWEYQFDPVYADEFADCVLRDGSPLWNGIQRVGTANPQSIIIPAKISSANAIYCIFRNGQGENDFRFDSLRRMTIGMDDTKSNSVTAQLRIGNELLPQSPIVSANEALEELLKAHHMDGFYGTCEKMGSIVCSGYNSGVDKVFKNQGKIAGDAFGVSYSDSQYRDLFRTGTQPENKLIGGNYIPRNDFNSQILCPNPQGVVFKYGTFTMLQPSGSGFFAQDQDNTKLPGYFSPAVGGTSWYSNLCGSSANFYYGTVGSGDINHSSILPVVCDLNDIGARLGFINVTEYAETRNEFTKRINKWKLAVRKAFFGEDSLTSTHQLVDPTKSNFLAPTKQHTGRYSTFMLGFDLDTFSHNSDTIRSGHYLGNNTVSLNLSKFTVVDNSPCNMALMSSLRMDTYVLHDLRLSFQAGGIVQAFY